jgi:hypothetical protein
MAFAGFSKESKLVTRSDCVHPGQKKNTTRASIRRYMIHEKTDFVDIANVAVIHVSICWRGGGEGGNTGGDPQGGGSIFGRITL